MARVVRRALLLPVLLLALLLSFAGGVVVVVKRNRDRAAVREALRLRAQLRGIPPDWLEALGETETGLRPLVNDTGTDAVRGGSYGPTQISARTARAFGYDGPMQRLLDDLDFAADLTARMVAEGFAELTPTSVLRADPAAPMRPVRYGPPATYRDMLAVWNAGRPWSQLPEGHRTRIEYEPRARDALAAIEAREAGSIA